MSENQDDRASIAAEVFGTNEEPFDQKNQEIESQTETPDVKEVTPEIVDPWAGVSAALREEVEGLRTKVSFLDEINLRLKQTENRIGGLTNDLRDTKEAAKTVAPTKEQEEKALAIQAEIDELKELLPGLDHKFAAERADMMKQIPNMEEMQKNFREASAVEREKMQKEFGTTLVSFKHPNFSETIKTPEFRQWHSQNGASDSFDPLVVIDVMDKFTEFQSKQKSSKDIAEERKQRLNLAQNPIGHKLPPIKSESDMSVSEMRAAEALKVWAKT